MSFSFFSTHVTFLPGFHCTSDESQGTLLVPYVFSVCDGLLQGVLQPLRARYLRVAGLHRRRVREGLHPSERGVRNDVSSSVVTFAASLKWYVYNPCQWLIFYVRYVLSLINRSVQFEDSGLDPKVASNFNLVSSHTASLASRLETVEENVVEIRVRQAEEEDSRINEG